MCVCMRTLYNRIWLHMRVACIDVLALGYIWVCRLNDCGRGAEQGWVWAKMFIAIWVQSRYSSTSVSHTLSRIPWTALHWFWVLCFPVTFHILVTFVASPSIRSLPIVKPLCLNLKPPHRITTILYWLAESRISVYPYPLSNPLPRHPNPNHYNNWIECKI